MSSSTNNVEHRPQWPPQTPLLARSAGSPQRLRSEDSWIEIASHPSSASLSSAGDNDIVIEGLNIRRRRSRQQPHRLHIQTSSEKQVLLPTGPASANGSSQDEYEESESESDRVLGSSNEDVGQLLGDDEDDNSTALGVGPAENLVFTLQPNAFSHPPVPRANRAAFTAPDSYFPMLPEDILGPGAAQSLPARTITRRNANQQRSSMPRSFPNDRRVLSETTQNNPKSQPDHDAALRASLTTLLSCAAAVRGSPKQRDAPSTSAPRRPSRTEPCSLRLVSESQLFEGEPSTVSRPSARHRSSEKTSTSPPKMPVIAKRKSRESSKERHTKKARNSSSKTSLEDELNSTLTSWMISAGVVLVFSAISFSAGYAWGKEVGRFEGEMGISSPTCGQEALRVGSGLRRMKWSTASSSVRA